MFNDFIFSRGIFTTHSTYIYALNVFSTWKITLAEFPLCNAKSVIVIFYVEKTFKCAKCEVNMLSKNKSEII